MVGGPSKEVKLGSAQRDESHKIQETWRDLARNVVIVMVIAATTWALCAAMRSSIEVSSEFLFEPFSESAGEGTGKQAENEAEKEPGTGQDRGGSGGWIWIVVGVLVAGGLARGLILQIPSWQGAQGSGIDQSLESFHQTYDDEDAETPSRYDKPTIVEALRRVVMTVLTVGTGGSGGLEAPVVPIGECLGAGWAKLTGTKNPDDLRVYMMAGIAAAVATLLDAPFTAALFAAEIIYLDRILYRTLIYSALGAIVAYALNNHFLLFEPLFAAPQRSHLYSMTEYAQVALVALFCSAPAGLGVAFVFTWLKKLIQVVPSIAQPLVGAAATGAIALVLWFGLGLEPQHVLGVGEKTLDQILHQEGNPLLQVWWILAILVVAKTFATGFTLMAGGSAGMLVPAMYLGGAMGALAHYVLIELGIPAGPDPALFMVAGIASALVAVAEVPLAAIAFVMEVFGAHFGPPAIVACVLTYLVAKRLRLYSEDNKS